MNKRFLGCLLICTLFLGGCKFDGWKRNAETPIETTLQSKNNSDENNAYLNIQCYEPKSYNYRYFSVKKQRNALGVMLPTEWEMQKADSNKYTILRSNIKIGEMILGAAADLSQWTVLKQTSPAYQPNAAQYLEKSGTGEDLSFRYRFVYQFFDGTVQQTATLTVDYSEISEFTATKLLASANTQTIQSDAGFGSLADCSGNSILILGNSFIGTSNIGKILNEMMESNPKTYTVQAISRGSARVQTYVEDSYIMNDIQHGLYDIVLICGFYSMDQLDHLKTLKSACNQSNTTLVLFPAHNESAATITAACEANPDLICLNWKAEIEELINAGVDQWDLCLDDAHKHSTELAGYVGAHMIYRAICNDVPSPVSSSINQSHVDQLPGNYAKTGCVPLVDPEKIFCFE